MLPAAHQHPSKAQRYVQSDTGSNKALLRYSLSPSQHAGVGTRRSERAFLAQLIHHPCPFHSRIPSVTIDDADKKNKESPHQASGLRAPASGWVALTISDVVVVVLVVDSLSAHPRPASRALESRGHWTESGEEDREDPRPPLPSSLRPPLPTTHHHHLHSPSWLASQHRLSRFGPFA